MSVDYRPNYDPADVDSDYGHTGGDITVPTFTANMKPFRFWCQKALPLVYDDSLSYYEVLCKVVKQMNDFLTDLQTATGAIDQFAQQFVINQQFLNDMADQLGQNIEDLETYINERMTDFMTAYTQLQDYVNNYFDNLDVQQEINNKLDEMASDGTFNDLFDPVITAWMTAKTAQIDAAIAGQDAIQAQQNGRISVLEGRMDTFASLPSGSTSGNAELLDIRTNFLGEVYPTAGEAVRASDMIASGFQSISATKLEEWDGNDESSVYDSIQIDIGGYKGGHVVVIGSFKYFQSDLNNTGSCAVYATNTPGEVEDANAVNYLPGTTNSIFTNFTQITTSISGEERLLLQFAIPDDFSYQYLKIGHFEHNPVSGNYTEPLYIVYANSWSKTQVDPTLSITGDAADAKATGDALDELNERMGNVVDTLETVNITEIEFTEGAYIATNKSETQIVDLTPVSSTGYKYAILDCKQGDRFELNGTSGSAPRLWAFLNVNNALISNAVTSLTANGLMITAPFGATKCVINNNDLTAQCFKWTSNAVDSSNIIKCNVVFEPSYYIATNGTTVPHTTEDGKIVFTKTSSFYSACAIIPCAEGQKIQVTGKGGGAPRLWAFVNKNGDILSNSASGVTETNAVIIAPQATAYCILNIYDTTLAFSATVFQNTEKTPDHGNIHFSDGYIATVSVGSAVNFTPVSNSDYKCAVVPCIEGQTFTITGTTEDNSGRRLYAFADLYGYMRYRENSVTQLSNESITAPITGNMIINVRKEFAYSASDNYPYSIRNPITSLPPSFMGSMAFKPMGTLSKGYICLMTDDGYDDGTHGLVQETIPLAIAKNVPFTFALMRNSDVCKDNTKLATVINAIENYGCSVAQHAEFVWDDKSEDFLNTFFDLEKAFFDSKGIELHGAVIPAHQTTELVKAICGGRFGVVRSGYSGIVPGTQDPSGTVTNYYNYYTSGEQSNLYCLSSYNNAAADASYNTAAVDYAYANNKILICYFHENAMTSEQWQKVGNMIDYAKTKGLEFITLGDIPFLLND